MEEFGLFSTISASVAAVAGIVLPLCSRKRTYTSSSNRILLEDIVKNRLTRDTSCKGGEVYTNGVWVPTMMCSLRKCYCSTLDVHVSQWEANEVTYTLSVLLLPCMSWASFEKSTDADPSNDGVSDKESSISPGHPGHKLPHLVRKGVQLAWPSWSIEQRYVLPPGVDEAQLDTAIALAARMKVQINDISGSGFFLVRGPKRTGKSTAAKLLAKMLGPQTLVCEEYNPTEPGNILTNLVSCRQDHDQTASLVIILEECDEWLQKIRDGHVFPPNPKLFTEVTGKSSWCPFAEKVLKMDRVVVICTCNMRDEERSLYDTRLEGAMLREERITAEYRTIAKGGFNVIHESSKNRFVMEAPKVEDIVMDRISSVLSDDDLEEPLI